MKKIFFNFILINLLLSTVALATPASDFARANELYKKKEFAQALTIYDSLLNQGYKNADLFFNAGDAAFKAKDMGKAVLYFEKARLLNPADEDVNFNLKLINFKLVDKVEPMPQLFFVQWWQNYLGWLSPGSWAVVGILFLFLFAGLLVVYYVFHFHKKIILNFSFICLLIGVFVLFTAYQSHFTLFKNNYGVIMPSNVTIKAAPDAASVDLFPLHEGLKVQVKEEVEGWYKIRLSDGKEGWCAKDWLGMI